MEKALRVLKPVPAKAAPRDREAHFVNRTLNLNEVEDMRRETCAHRGDCLDDALRVLMLNAVQRKRIDRLLESAKSFICADTCPYRTTARSFTLPRFTKSLVA